jgi:hypothetical protein
MTFLNATPTADASPGSTGGHDTPETPCTAASESEPDDSPDPVRAAPGEAPEQPATGVVGYRLGRRAVPPPAAPDDTGPPAPTTISGGEGASRAGPG